MFQTIIQGVRNSIAKWRKNLPQWSGRSLPVDRAAFAYYFDKKRPTFRQVLHLPFVLNRKELITFFSLFTLALISGIWLIKNTWSLFFMRVPARGGTYTEGIVGTPHYLNPLYASSNPVDRDITRLLFSGLIRFDKEGFVEPDLAQEVTRSDDAKEFTIILREGLTWSDGEALTSEDVRFTIETIKNPLYQSPLRAQFMNAYVEVTDERTARIILDEPSAPFLENLATGLIPSHIWSSIDPKNATLADANIKPVSAGPYEFASLSKDASGSIRSYTLKSRDEGIPFKPHLANITFKFYQNIPEAITALIQKNTDGLQSMLPERTDELKTRKDLVRYPLHLPQYVALFYRNGAHGALDRPEVRRALSLAIDREKIVAEVLKGEGSVIDSLFVMPAGQFNITASSTPFNQSEAVVALDAAGWKAQGENTVRKNSAGEELAIVITTLSQEDLFRTAEIIQKNWQGIGVKTSIQIVDAARIAGDIIRPRAYQALLLGELTGIDPDPYPFWHSSQIGERGLNLSDYANRDMDKLLEEARKTNDRAVREKNYQTVQTIIQKDSPATFLYTTAYPYLIAKKIQGVRLPALLHPSDRFAYIEEWYEETRWGLRPSPLKR